MEKDILERAVTHYICKHIYSDIYDGNFNYATKYLENQMDNSSTVTRCVIKEYWEDYFENRQLYSYDLPAQCLSF